MPPPDGSTSSLWEWSIGIASTLAAAIAGWLAARRSGNQDLSARLGVIERWKDERQGSCDRQRNEIMEELRKEIGRVVRAAIQDREIAYNKELAAIDKNLALQTQATQQIQEDVEAIFGRLNRRSDEQPLTRLTPHRRRKDDSE